MTDCTFIIPDTNAFQSGGNLYNARLIEALKSLKYTFLSFATCEISVFKVSILFVKSYHHFIYMYN